MDKNNLEKTKYYLAKLKSGLLKLTAPIRKKVNELLPSRNAKLVALVILLALEVLLAYLLAYIHMGIYLEDRSLSGILAAYMTTPENPYPWDAFLLFSFLLPILILYLLHRSNVGTDTGLNFIVSKSNVYGSGKEITSEELEEVADILPKEEATGTILGQLDTTGQKLICMKPGAMPNNNIFSVGPPGRGKTEAFVKPFILQAIRRGESVICTDTKSDLWAETVETARRYGYVVRRFDLRDPKNSDGWDILSELRHDDQRALVFAKTIMLNSGDEHDIHASSEESLLRAVCLYKERNAFDKFKTFPAAYDMLLEGTDALDNYFRVVDGDPDMEMAVNSYKGYTGSPNLRGNILSNLINRLRTLTSSDVRRMTATPDIDLDLPGKRPCLYYCTLSDQHETMKFLATLFFSFAILDLVDLADRQPDRKLKVPVNIMMEEFCNIGKMDTKYLNTVRSRGIGVSLVVQSIGQLREIYGTNVTNSILAACSTHLCLGFNDEDTAKLYEWRTGETTVQVKTEQHDAIESPLKIGRRHSTGDGRRAGYYTSNDLMKMEKYHALIVWQGYDCLMTHTFPALHHIEAEKGRMRTISTQTKIPLANVEARAFLRAYEEQRVINYENWLAQGGDPWIDYAESTPAKRGPMTGTAVPEVIPYPELEEMALAHAEQAKETTRLKCEAVPEQMPSLEGYIFEDGSDWEHFDKERQQESAEEAAEPKPTPKERQKPRNSSRSLEQQISDIEKQFGNPGVSKNKHGAVTSRPSSATLKPTTKIHHDQR